MGFNFPDAPTIGQLHPTPAVVGIPQYQWNGSEWVTPEYNPLNYVLKSGDTMLGALNVVTPPTQAAHAASKSYVDTYAAPLDALSYSGMQVNGSMEVSQELGSSGTSLNGGHICDGWIFSFAGTMSVVGARVSASIVPGFPVGLIQVGVSVAQTSLGANDVCYVLQRIEGYRVARLGWGTVNAKPITLCFWSSHSKAGVFTGNVRNTGTRSYAFTYTQAVAGQPQYNTIVIPGCTDGTWDQTNLIGITVGFAVACGSTFIAPTANTWVAGNYIAAPGQINAVAATSDVFRITGVVILPGIYAPTAAQSPLIMRSYDQELMTCGRYFSLPEAGTQMISTGAGNNYGATYHFPVPMRATPTMTVVQWILSINMSGNPVCANVRSDSFIYFAAASSAAGMQYVAQFKADARL